MYINLVSALAPKCPTHTETDLKAICNKAWQLMDLADETYERVEYAKSANKSVKS